MDFFLQTNHDLDDDLILFSKNQLPIHHQTRETFDFFYFVLTTDKKSSRFTNLDIIGQCNTGMSKTVATFYKSSEYSTAIKELIINEKYRSNIYLHISRTVIEGGSMLTIETYMRSGYADRLFNGEIRTLNLFLFTTIKYQFLKLRMSQLAVASETNIRSETDYSRGLKLYNYQNLNITWMLSKEQKSQSLSVTAPKLSYNIYHIETIDRYLILDYSGRIIREQTCDKLDYNYKGGVLCDDVGLGKTISIVSTIQENSKGTTLVLCPTRLCVQWGAEIKKASTLTYKLILNITQYKKFVRENQKYDIVVAPYTFFTNKNYNQFELDNPAEPKLLTNYNWERVVLDEAHEYLKYSKRKNDVQILSELFKLKGDYKWICSATPLTSFTSINYTIRFLSGLKFDVYKHGHHISHILKTMYRKNTKESIKQEIVIPEPILTTHLLNFTALERNIYDSATTDDERRKYCNHVLVDSSVNGLGANVDTLQDIHTKMSMHYNDKIKRISKRMEAIHPTDFEYDTLKTKLDTYNQKLKVFNGLDAEITKNTTCPICLDEFANLTRVITPCGHFFCSLCLASMSETSSVNKCAICRTKYTSNELHMVKNTTDHEKLGTKITFLLDLLSKIQETKTDKIIIFSKYEAMLKILKKVFDSKLIKSLFVSGSVYVMNSKLTKFKTSDINIILMSSEKYPSGLNLVEATHIILLDTMYKKKSEIKTIETQAIGRAFRLGQNKHIKVDRLIIRDTIEHKNFLNYSKTSE